MPAPRTPWWASIVTRITVVFTVFIVGAALLAGYLIDRGLRMQQLRATEAGMVHTLRLADERLSAFTTTLDEDIAFLAQNEPVLTHVALRDSGDTAALRTTRERLALLLESFIRSRTDYAQVRLLAADSSGRELVRYDRDGLLVQRVPDSLLQDKGDRDYFLAARELGPGGRQFSAIDLNKEHGQVQLPPVPTLRATAPVFTPEGERMGVVVINADLRSLFAGLQALPPPGSRLMLADANGQLLLHPDTARMFRFEFGGAWTLRDEAGVALLNDSLQHVGEDLWLTRATAPHALDRTFTLALAEPYAGLLAVLRAHERRNLLLAGAVALAFAVCALLFARSLVTRLARLTTAVDRYTAGDETQLPTGRRDEIGHLARALEHQQRTINARVKELEEARDRAEAADRQRRELLANMSHEVRTPLNAIIGMAGELDVSVLSPPDRERLGLVQRSAARLRRLVDDLLLHARIGEGKLELQPGDADVEALLRDLLRAHLPQAMAKSLALRSDLTSAPTRFRTDALRLHQVVDNLLGNAVRYTTTGTVDLGVAREADGRLSITVRDTGPGLTEEQRARVFQRFERATTAEQDDGAGIGLAITLRLTQLLGGALEVESTPGVGSRFTVRIPELREAGVTAPPVLPVDPSLTAGLRVLYVEDTPSSRALVEAKAARWGWQLDAVATAREALEQTAKAAYDLILVDLDLGEGMRGAELTLRLRGLVRTRYTPILAVSAYTEGEAVDEAMKAGVNDRVGKPIDADELLRKVAFWSGRFSPADVGRADPGALEAQYDHLAEPLLKAMQQYRTELAQGRAALLRAVAERDGETLHGLHHKLRPHLQLFKLDELVALLDEIKQGSSDAMVVDRVQRGLLTLERDLLMRQAQLLEGLRGAATTGPAA
ncbi:MAG: response regulator [Flavobacteriales bacterium]|nr:response regulator [Flavobacteriales bacterium]